MINYDPPSMALPNKFYQEDKLLKRKRAAANLGKEASIGDGEYSPNGRQSAVSSTTSDNIHG